MADINKNVEKSMASRPMNVEQIVRNAQSYDYNPLVPLKYWLRTAGTIIKEAEIYEHEGNDQQTYLLLFRHAQLVVNNLSKHPDVRKSENRQALTQANNDVTRSLKKLEVLRPRINARYERYEQLQRDRDARRASVDANKTSTYAEDVGGQRSSQRYQQSDPALAGSTQAIAAGDNKDLAVKLAHSEIRRRATARKATRQAGISEKEEHERRTAGVWGNWEEAFTKGDQGVDQDTLSRQMQNVRMQVNGSESKRNGVSRRPSFESSKSGYRYPTIPTAHDTPTPSIPSAEQSTTQRSEPLPQLPPKQIDPLQQATPLPPRPAKEELLLEEPPSPAKTPTASQIKPSTFTFRPSAYLENGTPLRTMFLPPDLRHQFLSLALPNTRANLETCGILCGTLISNALFVSKLVIPDQESTSDTCETINESDLFDYVDGEDLMVLGWIHTHPKQTCFMSSRDLHTHSGYQMMMTENIAIVCAPSQTPDWGVFRLTDPPGLKFVLNCTQSGLFHPHSIDNLYTDALRPGHVYEAKGLEFEVVDLRSKK